MFKQPEGEKLEAPPYPVPQEFDRKLETFKKDGTLDFELLATRLKELKTITSKSAADAKNKVGPYAEQILLIASGDSPKAIRVSALEVIGKLPKEFAPAVKDQLAFLKHNSKDRDVAAAADAAAKELGLGNLKAPPRDRPLGVPEYGPHPTPGPNRPSPAPGPGPHTPGPNAPGSGPGPNARSGRSFGGPNLQLPPRRN